MSSPTQTFTPFDPAYDQRVRDSFANQAVMTTLGVRLTDLGPGRCELRMPFRADLTQQDGFLHAGIVTTVSDSAAGYAAYTLMPADSSVLSIEYKQNLMAPATGEVLVARGEVIRSGRTITVVVAHAFMIKDGVEKPVGLLQATMMCLANKSAS